MNYTLRNLLIASALMLVGILAITSFLRAERQELSRGKQEVQVLVAAKDIPAGTSAKELESGGYLETTELLIEDSPDGAVGKVESLKDGKKWLTSDETIYSGEVLTSRAFDKSTGLAPTHQIKGNERLYAVPIQASSDAAGLIKPGDFVDVHAGIKLDSGQQTAGTLVARDVEVIETPESLTPKGIEVTEEAPSAEGDTKLYVFTTTDEEWQQIMWALGNSDDYGLMLALRPSNGDTETKLPPIIGVYKTPTDATTSLPAPNPSSR
jgi:pilus assembly protein CpaB